MQYILGRRHSVWRNIHHHLLLHNTQASHVEGYVIKTQAFHLKGFIIKTQAFHLEGYDIKTQAFRLQRYLSLRHKHSI